MLPVVSPVSLARYDHRRPPSIWTDRGAGSSPTRRGPRRVGDATQTRCELAVDDFGTGYAVARLPHSLPVDMRQIDMSVRLASDRRPEAAPFVRSPSISPQLGHVVVAEVVEDIETFSAGPPLRPAQGTTCTRPLPADELTTWFDTADFPPPRRPEISR